MEFEAQVDALLDGVTSHRGRSRSVASRTPMPGTRSRPATESPNKRQSVQGDAQDDPGHALLEFKEESPRVQAARGVYAIFKELFPKWEALVAADDGNSEERRSSLRRFEYGMVLYVEFPYILLTYNRSHPYSNRLQRCRCFWNPQAI